uniref:(northern house mosquito) hypothetical protein n=1 Tax=Culex pipiens TaxID=7175 RepID=A0A8D8I336_CULPI
MTVVRLFCLFFLLFIIYLSTSFNCLQNKCSLMCFFVFILKLCLMCVFSPFLSAELLCTFIVYTSKTSSPSSIDRHSKKIPFCVALFDFATFVMVFVWIALNLRSVLV